jgi:hypothetical protein
MKYFILVTIGVTIAIVVVALGIRAVKEILRKD